MSNVLHININQLSIIHRYSSIHTNKYVINHIYESKPTSSDNVPLFYFHTDDVMRAKQLTRKYNLFSFYSFLIQYDVLIDTLLENDRSIALNMETFLHCLQNSDVDEIIHDYLVVLEHGPIKGYHINYVLITNKPLTNIEIELFRDSLELNGLNVTDCQENQFYEILPIIKHQKIKSPASWIHYLKKHPICIASNKVEILQMFSSFDRTHIFNEESVPAKYKRTANGDIIVAGNDMVHFFMYCFDHGHIDLIDIMKVPDASKYFHLQNFNNTYKNCYNAFLAKRTLTDEIIYILQEYINLESSQKCFCPVNDWLEYQEININTFMQIIGQWIFATKKANVLYFIGPANCGKSHFARLVWSCFLSHKLILQDGIYSFANLQNAGCGLWEEPLVLPDFVDTCKLIFEGEPSTEVAVKHSPSLKLGKRIPLLITTNNELSTYCSNQHPFLEARLYRISIRKQCLAVTFCEGNNGEHYCPLITDHTHHELALDETCCSNSTTTDNSSEIPERRRNDCGSQELLHDITEYECSGLHMLQKNHILSYLAYIIYNYWTTNTGSLQSNKFIDFIQLELFIRQHRDKLRINSFNFCPNSLNKPSL